ncbi:hypothetical protein ABPG74_003632 [Tetrahymena malaccensis]
MDQHIGQKQAQKDDYGGEKFQKQYQCKCGKSYDAQGTIYNHVKKKHNNNKKWIIEKKPKKKGRPTLEEQRRRQENGSEQKNGIQYKLIYENPLFANLMIEFKEKMRETTSEDILQIFKKNWIKYEKQRDDLFNKISFSNNDRKNSLQITDMLLQTWAQVISPEFQVDLLLIFISQYILTYHEISNQKKEIIQQHIDYIPDNQDLSKKIKGILNKEYDQNQIDDNQIKKRKNNDSILEHDLAHQENQNQNLSTPQQNQKIPKINYPEDSSINVSNNQLDNFSNFQGDNEYLLNKSINSDFNIQKEENESIVQNYLNQNNSFPQKNQQNLEKNRIQDQTAGNFQDDPKGFQIELMSQLNYNDEDQQSSFNQNSHKMSSFSQIHSLSLQLNKTNQEEGYKSYNQYYFDQKANQVKECQNQSQFK